MRLCCLILAPLLTAGEAPAPPLPPDAVARIGERVITLRELETSLLRKEGQEQVLDWAAEQLAKLDWANLPDDAVVLSVAGHELRRRDLALSLLRKDTAKVREELIGIAIVEAELQRQGIVIDDALLASEYRMMEREFHRTLKAKGQGHIDFASYLKAREQMSAEDLMRQPSTRMAAGLHELVRRRILAELDDARLQAHLDANRQVYDIPESVDVSIIHIPYQKQPDGGVAQDEQIKRQVNANIIRRSIEKGELTFAKAWEAFGKGWDPVTDGAPGRVGWVARDGRRLADENARPIPGEVVARAFAAEGLPALLPPVIHATGVDVVRVDARRAARSVTLAEVRDRIRQDLLEGDLKARTEALLSELRRTGPPVEYGSIPELIRQREAGR
jgi:hypothetical protein